MSSNNRKTRADSKARNKKRLHKNAVAKTLEEQQDLAELLNDIGLMLSTAHGYTETLGAVLKVYQPLMTPEENTACTSPWGVLVTDLTSMMKEYTVLNASFKAYKPPVKEEGFLALSTDTIQGLNLYHTADNITSNYGMVIAPLLLDSYSQVSYIVNKYGEDKMSEVGDVLKQNYENSKVGVEQLKESK